MGVSGPYRRFFGAFLAHCIKKPVWLSSACAWALTEVHGGPPSIAFRWIIMHMWQASRWRRMVNLGWSAAWKHVMEKNMKYKRGTWESNPGPSTCMPLHPPTKPTRIFVIWITKKHNMQKRSLVVYTRKYAPVFEYPNRVWTHQHLLHLFACNIIK